MSTFVAVGNMRLPFTRLLSAVDMIARDLPQPVLVQSGHTPFHSAFCEASSFLEMNQFELEFARAQLVIIQAGAGSMIQALRAGKFPVVVPRRAQFAEHIDDHQLELARAFAEAGRVEIVEDIATLLDAANAALARQRTCLSLAITPTPLVTMVAAAMSRRRGERADG